jgi:hypothetical protein
MSRAVDVLSIEPRGLNRVKAAAYVGVSTSLFGEMVDDGRMPSPKMINARRLWDRRELDLCFDALPSKEESNPWDDVLSP